MTQGELGILSNTWHVRFFWKQTENPLKEEKKGRLLLMVLLYWGKYSIVGYLFLGMKCRVKSLQFS